MRAISYAILTLTVLAIVYFGATQLGKAIDDAFATTAARIEQGGDR